MVKNYYLERFGAPSAGSEYNSDRAALKNIEDTIIKNLSGDQNSQFDYFNQIYTQFLKPNGETLYIQDELTGKMREVKTKAEVAEALTQTMISLNAIAKDENKKKGVLSGTLSVASLVPYIKGPSKIIKGILNSMPNRYMLNRTDVVVNLSTKIIDSNISNNKVLSNSFNNLDKISNNPNNASYRSEFSNNAKNILNIYYNTYKPFVR